MRLERDKLMLQNDIDKLIEKMNGVEDKLYGRKMFTLESNDGQSEYISTTNLRSESRGLMKITKTVY
jgi:hypothetical protein